MHLRDQSRGEEGCIPELAAFLVCCSIQCAIIQQYAYVHCMPTENGVTCYGSTVEACCVDFQDIARKQSCMAG
jgi:hypothetical protein